MTITFIITCLLASGSPSSTLETSSRNLPRLRCRYLRRGLSHMERKNCSCAMDGQAKTAHEVPPLLRLEAEKHATTRILGRMFQHSILRRPPSSNRFCPMQSYCYPNEIQHEPLTCSRKLIPSTPRLHKSPPCFNRV